MRTELFREYIKCHRGQVWAPDFMRVFCADMSGYIALVVHAVSVAIYFLYLAILIGGCDVYRYCF